MKSEKVLVTGASGFIGSHILKHLVAQGYHATGQVRSTSSLFRLKSNGSEPDRDFPVVRFSLEDSFERYLDGVDTIIHTAARASDWGNPETFDRINVQGTEALAEKAVNTGVKRFVYLSSTVVYGFGGHRETSESAPFRPFPNPYCRSKTAAEQTLMPFRDKLELFVLRPANVFGPWDTSFTFPLFRALDRGLIGFPGGGRNLTAPCFVGNLVEAARLCLEADSQAAGTFNISDGADLPWHRFLEMIASELGTRPPLFPIPPVPLRAAAFVSETVRRVLGRSSPPRITSYRIAQVSRDYGFSIKRAVKALGFTPPFSTLQGIRESVGWYRLQEHAYDSQAV
jgi:nucleoside-diphosphate-sugar epimerase